MLTIVLGNDWKAVGQWFGMLRTFAANLVPVLTEVRDEIEDMTDEHFESEGGGQWAPHRPLTQLRRGPGAKLMVDSGDLRDSFKHGGADHVEDMGPDFLETGSAHRAASPHHYGFRNKGTVPAEGDLTHAVKMRGQRTTSRPLFGERRAVESRIADRFEDELYRYLGI